ncbi:5-oxoprolinase/urea amidolyase family protein [Brevibacterium sp. BRM-1]|uniref:5-oxoprolinase subunit B/C family protein n=1 Tax=Brevibacterium sp. BRM-1 TaxID=2999062 RepID=UPI00227FEF5F|nr:5-oxoprolinase/urea amidolyase family protein [Brevibacterium sp. BRM-1]WAL39936.1 5-oxoprolinase/urea amidolyase family protein [Brevibacterium sp. BRM-1]
MRPRAVLPAGDRALLVELGSIDAVMAAHAALTAQPLPGQVEAVAAAATVLVRFETPRSAASGAECLRALDVDAAHAPEGREIAIDVVYDGEDLEAAAAALGLGTEALVERHTRQAWRAAFAGFAPGFVYCDAPDGGWETPRRDEPRTRVPAGSVGLAGAFSAVYPTASPGGWQLIGRTDARLFDPDRTPPALIAPGDRVRYRAVRAQATAGTRAAADTGDRPQTAEPAAGAQPAEPASQAAHGPAATASGTSPTPSAAAPPAEAPAARPQPGSRVLRIESPGLQALSEDAGRAGLGDQGVSRSGAADREAFAQANRLVGNPEGTPAIEILLGGLTATALADCALAVTGAQCPIDVKYDGAVHRMPLCAPFAVPAGARLSLGRPSAGMRAYLALRGGFDLPRTLGSSASDVLSGLGPPPLAAGDELRAPIPAASAPGGAADPAGASPNPGCGLSAAGDPEPTTLREAVLRVIPGPRADWFEPAALEALTAGAWTVTERSNRVGLRLEGERPLKRAREGELLSEGMVFGSVQVPPSGQPVVFLADHPVTGGYPVIATVITADLPIAAQAAPGTALRFALAPPKEPDHG